MKLLSLFLCQLFFTQHHASLMAKCNKHVLRSHWYIFIIYIIYLSIYIISNYTVIHSRRLICPSIQFTSHRQYVKMVNVFVLLTLTLSPVTRQVSFTLSLSFSPLLYLSPLLSSRTVVTHALLLAGHLIATSQLTHYLCRRRKRGKENTKHGHIW